MLTEVRIANLGVIADALLTPCPGLTVVTGETGAGKTMVVTGLGLVGGSRGETRLVRAGAERAVVEARFTDPPPPVADAVRAAGGELDDDELLVARQIGAGGRSRFFMGGVQVPAARGAELGDDLVTIHGQAEQRRLSSPERQREVLDRAAGADLAEVLHRYRDRYARRAAARAELAALRADQRERAREEDILRYGLDEIARVDPQPGEDVALAAEAQRLQVVDDLRLASHRALVALSGDEDDLDQASVLGLVSTARKALETTAGRDPLAEPLAGRAAELASLAADLAADVASYLADLDADPARSEWIASRRSQLQGLLRKYGATVDEVLAWSAEQARRLSSLTSSEERMAELVALDTSLSESLTTDAAVLTGLRSAAASRVATAVHSELSALAMPYARLVFELAPLRELGPHGADSVALLFSANRGSELGPLGALASGGELSRVRLALEVTLADTHGGQVFVFDEVDAGVGGAVALEIGSRLARLAQTRQVIVVTHLAQVAAFGDRHVVVAKADDGVTTSSLTEVTGDDRLRELARMMAGLEETDSSLAHAAELVARASEAHRRRP